MLPLRRLAPYFARYRGRLIAGIASVLGAAVVGLAAPLLIGAAVDSLREGPEAGTLLRYGALLVAVTLVQGGLSFAQRRLLVAMSRDIELDLRDDYYGHLQTLPPSFYRDNYTGDLMARATNDLQAVRMICGPAIMYSSNTLFTAIGALLIPDGFTSVEGNVLVASVGLAVAAVVTWLSRQPFLAVLAAVAAVAAMRMVL